MTGDRLNLAAVALEAAPARQLALAFASDPGGRTYLERQRVAYPFHVCRALHVPGDAPGFCTVYVQSCSGGIFENDRLAMRACVDAGAKAHLTTAASTVVHSMPSGHAEQAMVVEAGPDAVAEYLPDPLILFPQSRLDTRLTVRAHPSATVVAAESFLLHDYRGRGDHFEWLRSESRVEDENGALLALDRFRVTGATLARGLPGVNGALTMQGTLLVVHRRDPQAALDALRAVLPEGPRPWAGASLLPGDCGAWLRVLSDDAVAMRNIMRDAWASARHRLTGAMPGIRRK